MHPPTKKATPKDRLFHIESLLAYSTVPASAQHVLALVHKYIENSTLEPRDQAPPFGKGRGWGGNVNMASKKLYMHPPTKKATQKDRLFHIESTLAYSTVPASAEHVLALVHKYIINSSSEPRDQAPPFGKGRGWGGNVNMASKKLYMHPPTNKATPKGSPFSY